MRKTLRGGAPEMMSLKMIVRVVRPLPVRLIKRLAQSVDALLPG